LNRALAASLAAAAAPISGKGVFAACIMAGVAYMALSIPRLVPVEVVERLRTALRQRSMVTLARVVAVVDVAVKAVRAVKPGACS
jgi:serine phosphatase RsbU (regulator of sigma subunit)